MSQINVNTKNLKKEARDLEQAHRQLKNIINDIESCGRFGGTQSIANAVNTLKRISTELNSEKNTVDSMRKALEAIVFEYEKTEKDIVAEGRKSKFKHDAQDAINDIIDKIKDLLKNWGNNGDGKQKEGAFDGDPVNVCTGNYFFFKELLKIEGMFPIEFTLYYNGNNPLFTSVGCGWSHSYMNWLRIDNDTIVFRSGDGREEMFRLAGQNDFESIYGNYNKLIKNEEGYVLETEEKIKLQFDKQGMILREENKYGNYVEYIYEEGVLAKVRNNSSCALEFSYNKKGHLVQVSDHTGRCIDLEYKNDNLVTITSVDGAQTSFTYDGQHELVKLVNALGVKLLVNEYDEERRVVRQFFPDGGTMTYEYPDSERVIYTDCAGNQKTYFHDSKLRHVGTKTEYGEDKKQFSELNKCTLYEDFAGNQTHYSYDVRGNVVSVRDSYGANTNLEYSDANRLVKSIRPNGQTAYYDYNELGNPVKMVDPEGNEENYIYDENGNVITIKKADGYEVGFEYDANGNAVKLFRNQIQLLTYEYDELNRMVAVIDEEGHKTSYLYDMCDRVIEIQNVMGDVCSFEYNKLGQMVKKTDYDQYTEEWVYNEIGMVAAYKNKEGFWTEFEYDANWNLSKVLEANGAVTEIFYNAGNKVERVLDPLNGEYLYKYDELMNCTEVSLNALILAAYKYDANGNCTEIRNESGDVYRVQYDESGRLVKTKDPSGKEVRFEYDMCDRVKRQIDSKGREKVFEYNETGKIISVKDDLGEDITCEYYPGGKVKQVFYSNGLKEFFAYDVRGNLIEKSNNLGYIVTFRYDALNRIIDQKSNLGEQKSIRYDAMGQIAEVIDAKGDSTKFEYTRQGKLCKVTDVNGVSKEYKFDELDQLIYIENVSVYERNLLGDVTKITDALGNSSTYEYNSFGKVTVKTDEDGNEIKYVYNGERLVEEIIYSDGRKASFEYDEMQNVRSVTDWLGKTSFSYDATGEIDKIINYDGRVMSYGRNKSGNCTSVVYPNGQEVIYEYNDKKQLVKIQNGQDNIEYIYNDNGTLKEKRFSDGTIESLAVNEKGLMKEHKITKNGELLDQMIYAYDTMGNMISMERERVDSKEVSGVYRYEYNASGQLTKVFRNEECIRTYTFDVSGNRLTKEENDRCISYKYNDRNQLIEENIVSAEGNVKKTYMYDKRGNLLRQFENGILVLLMEYDAQNHLSKVTDREGRVTEYTYNALGFRVEKNSSEGKTTYFSDYTRFADNLLMSSDDNGDKIYLWANSMAGVRTEDKLDFYCCDEYGTVIRSHNENMTNAYTYDEFGEPLLDTWQGDCQIGFAGYQKEEIEGFYFGNARYYMAEHGRYVAADILKGMTIHPLSLNEYVYCLNNPKKYVDKDGRAWHIAIGAVIGGVVNAGFEIYDQVKAGEFNAKSWDSWKKVGVEFLSGAASGAVTAAAGPVAGAIATGVCDAGAGITKDLVDGEELSVAMVGDNVAKGALSGLLSYGLGKVADKADDFLTKKLSNWGKEATSKFGKYFDDFMTKAEIEPNLDWLIKYATGSHLDDNLAWKWIRQYVEKATGGSILEGISKNGIFGVTQWALCKLFF